MSNYYKYPRTPHLPWSPGASSDDTRILTASVFCGNEVIVSEKMDGENTTLYRDHLHARSLDSRHHSSRDWLKRWHASIAPNIPSGWRISGENLFARHSISYQQLSSYFYGFSIWNDNGECCSWDETLEWFEMLKIHPVPVLYRGQWDEEMIRRLDIDISQQEGYVVRTAKAFKYEEFDRHVAKWVRSEHVQSKKHWMHQQIITNSLKKQP